MFQRGSHWVSARMSEALKTGEPQQAACGDVRETDRATAAPDGVGVARPEIQQDTVSRLPVAAGDAHPETASPAVQPVALAASIATDGATSKPAAPDADAPRPSRVMLPVLSSRSEAASDASRTQRIPRVFFAAATIVAVLAIGPGGMSVPNPTVHGARMTDLAEDVPEPRAMPVEVEIPVHTADASPAPKDARPLEEQRAPTNANANEERPSDPLRFADATLCTDAVCKTLLVHRAPDSHRPSLEPVLGAAVGLVATAEAGALRPAGPDTAPPPREPAESVTPAPETPAASQGAREDAENRERPNPLGELGEIEFVLLPKDGPDTARAKVALRQRDGRELAQFDVKIDHSLIAEALRAQGERDEDDEPERDAAEDEIDPPETAADAPAVAPATKRKQRAQRPKAAHQRKSKASQPAKSSARKAGNLSARAALPQQRAPIAPQPRGLFTLQAPPASQPADASRQAAAAVPRKKAEEVSSSDLASQSTPRTAGRPPGFETLMRLGGGFSLGSRDAEE